MTRLTLPCAPSAWKTGTTSSPTWKRGWRWCEEVVSRRSAVVSFPTLAKFGLGWGTLRFLTGMKRRSPAPLPHSPKEKPQFSLP